MAKRRPSYFSETPYTVPQETRDDDSIRAESNALPAVAVTGSHSRVASDLPCP